MKFTTHQEHFADTGEEIECFELTTRKGYAFGFVHTETICIHHIGTNEGYRHPVKGLMNMLCRHYETTKFRFLMVTNPELKNIIKGIIVLVPSDAPDNPFGEVVEEIHGDWRQEAREKEEREGMRR